MIVSPRPAGQFYPMCVYNRYVICVCVIRNSTGTDAEFCRQAAYRMRRKTMRLRKLT